MMIRTFDSNYYSSLLQNTQTLTLPNNSTPILMLNNKINKIKMRDENNSLIFLNTFVFLLLRYFLKRYKDKYSLTNFGIPIWLK